MTEKNEYMLVKQQQKNDNNIDEKVLYKSPETQQSSIVVDINNNINVTPSSDSMNTVTVSSEILQEKPDITVNSTRDDVLSTVSNNEEKQQVITITADQSGTNTVALPEQHTIVSQDPQKKESCDAQDNSANDLQNRAKVEVDCDCDIKKEEYIMMVAKKAKQLVGKNGDVYGSEPIFIKVITNKVFMAVTAVGLLLGYLILGHLLSFVRYVSELLVFTVMPLKIALHVFSSDSDLRQNIENTIAETTDIKELKQAYRQSRRIKRIRLDYGGTLLRQTLIVFLIRLMIMMLPFFEIIPFIGLFSNYVYTFLLVSIIIVQTPTTLLNSMIDFIADKLNIRSHAMYFTCPLSDKIVLWLKASIGDSKIASVRTIRDILLKYDEKSTLQFEDVEKMIDALDNLGISKGHLKIIGLEINNINSFIENIKNKTDLLFSNGVQLIFDDNTNIKELMTNAVRKTVNKTTEKQMKDL